MIEPCASANFYHDLHDPNRKLMADQGYPYMYIGIIYRDQLLSSLFLPHHLPHHFKNHDTSSRSGAQLLKQKYRHRFDDR